MIMSNLSNTKKNKTKLNLKKKLKIQKKMRNTLVRDTSKQSLLERTCATLPKSLHIACRGQRKRKR